MSAVVGRQPTQRELRQWHVYSSDVTRAELLFIMPRLGRAMRLRRWSDPLGKRKTKNGRT
jgi:hypothetical protein